MISGEGKADWSQEEKNIAKNTQFKIYGTLKKTVFATSFEELRNLTQQIRENPDDFLSETPQLGVCFIELILNK